MTQEENNDIETKHIASDLSENGVHSVVAEQGIRLSIWFFIGLILVIYGLVITGYGIYELRLPVVKHNYHASIWWGAVQFIWGAIYLWKFSPKGKK